MTYGEWGVDEQDEFDDLDIAIEIEGACEHEFDHPTRDLIERMQSTLGLAGNEIERLRHGICKASVYMDQKAPGLARETLQELVTKRPSPGGPDETTL